MKRIVGILCLLVLLTGCTGKEAELDRAMSLRAKLLAQAVSFDADITADYGDKTFAFSMSCQTDTQGNLTFTVTAPSSIAGITGTVSSAGGKLTFDEQALSFDLMADGQLSPVSGPWILMQTLRGGYLTSCTVEGERLRVAIDDSYAEDALHLDIWLNEKNIPVRGEILWEGRRLLSIEIKNFAFL